jgi:hypothetical protein
MADGKEEEVKKEKEPKPKATATAKLAVKPEKKAKAPKKNADAEAGEFGAKRKYEDKTKIKVLNKENPHREGSKRAEAFYTMKGCKTMGDFYESGIKTKYIQDWIDSEHIEVV